MIEWILKQNPTIFFYLILSPVLLLILIPLIPLHSETYKISGTLLFVYWLQILMYVLFTALLGVKLIDLDKTKFVKITKKSLVVITAISLLLFSHSFYLLIFSPSQEVHTLYFVISFLLFFTLEAFCLWRLSQLIISQEQQKKANKKDTAATFFLLLNPLIGWWNVHARLKKILLAA